MINKEYRQWARIYLPKDHFRRAKRNGWLKRVKELIRRTYRKEVV